LDKQMLHRAYEELIVQASLDPAFGAYLLADPHAAALAAGCSAALAASLADLRAPTLADFARELHLRIYGVTPAGSAFVPNPIRPRAAGDGSE
jgi:hypothetical protein